MESDTLSLREKLERAIVRALVSELRKAGYVPQNVWNGGEYVDAHDVETVVAAVFAVDESTIHFEAKNDNAEASNRGVFIVLGNGEDCISDWHSRDPKFTAAIERVCERIKRVRVLV